MNALQEQKTATDLAPASQSSSIIEIIARAAADPNVDVSKMSALLDMQERVMAKQAEIEFNEALARLSSVMPRITKDGAVAYADKNGVSKEAFKFATYENIDKAIRPHLQAEGFSLSFTTAARQGDGGGIMVTGTLSHKSGHGRSATIPVALDTSGGKNNIQAMGSSFSYGKRYTTTMLLNIVTESEDDDGVRGAMEFITAEQVQQVEALITETRTDRDRFLQMWQLARTENIEKRDFVKVMNMLAAKKIAQANKGAA